MAVIDTNSRGVLLLVTGLAICVWGVVLYQVFVPSAPPAPPTVRSSAAPDRDTRGPTWAYRAPTRSLFQGPPVRRRRPPSPSAPSPPENPLPALSHQLVGTLDGAALIRHQRSLRRVEINDSLAGRRIVSIQSGRLILEHETTRDTLFLAHRASIHLN